MVPSLHAAAALLLAIAMFYGFASGRRPEIVSLLTIGIIALGLYVFPLVGTAPQDGLALAFGGFGHHALITICALMILGRGLVVTGALQPATRNTRAAIGVELQPATGNANYALSGPWP